MQLDKNNRELLIIITHLCVCIYEEMTMTIRNLMASEIERDFVPSHEVRFTEVQLFFLHYYVSYIHIIERTH